jgi:hypothetical protein
LGWGGEPPQGALHRPPPSASPPPLPTRGRDRKKGGCAPAPRRVSQENQRARRAYPPPVAAAYAVFTSSRGKGAWPATDAAAGGDRAGLGWRGLRQRVRGAWRCRPRPPSASLGIGVRVLMIRVPWRPEFVGNGEPDPARPQQGRLPDADGKRWRGAVGFVETVTTQNTPDVVRRSATLSTPSAAFRVKSSPVGEVSAKPTEGGGIGRWPDLRCTIPKLPPPIAARSPPPQEEDLGPR